MITLQIAGRYIVLKSKLGVSTSNFFTIIISINSLVQNQHQEYIIVFGEAKNNILMVLKRGNTVIYQDLTLPLFDRFRSVSMS